ncbi:MAG: segregation/condensation protein A [Flavobacterium sp.]|nr:segregation/condensation protein A [Flavobacterium sp.]
MYKVRLQNFEGPLDLLLFFIRRDEVDIYDIPIAKITKEFVAYLRLLKQLDLEVAGDFILMAATLMQIKVKMLLPREIDEKGEEIDPRADLVNALIEYKRYKEVSEEMSFLESNQRKLSYRSNFANDYKENPVELDVLLKNITLYDLMKAFKKVLMDRKDEVFHKVTKMNVSIDEQIDFIMEKLELKPRIDFITLVKEMKEKIRIIVTFIALLELIKMGRIGIKESPNFNDFEIYRLSNG